MKEFKITEEQIKENKDLTLKEYFKEVFETKLEVGKWYKSKKSIALVFVNKPQECRGVIGYGFDGGGAWTDSWFNEPENEFTKATEEEVFDALKKEAEKRGYKVDSIVKCLTDDKIVYIECIDYDFWFKGNSLFINDNCKIFENGKWAEIIEQPEEIIELNGVKYKRID